MQRFKNYGQNQSLNPVLLFVCWALCGPIVHCDLIGAILELFPILKLGTVHASHMDDSTTTSNLTNHNLHVYSNLGTIHCFALALCLCLETFYKLIFLENMALLSWGMAY